MAGCVFGYFADCTVVMLLFLLIAILLLCRDVGVGMRRFGWSSTVVTSGLALAEEPTFHNVFKLPVNKSVPKNKVTLH